MTGKKAILTLMNRHGVNNAEMAGRLGITQAALWSRLDPRKSDNMTVRTLAEMCYVLGYEVKLCQIGEELSDGELLLGDDESE